jgi:hypothetical protein
LELELEKELDDTPWQAIALSSQIGKQLAQYLHVLVHTGFFSPLVSILS